MLKKTENTSGNTSDRVLVLGGTGKTGRRIVDRLQAKNVEHRVGSRSSSPSFDWNDVSTWETCLRNVEAAYFFSPDLAVDNPAETVQAFLRQAQASGVQRIVLLSGRGEEKAGACERMVQASGLDWTIIRASWFNQNFSEGGFTDLVLSGQITLPAGEKTEPFVDVDDIADVAVAALTEPGHHGEIYEVTGPRLLSFADIATELSNATGREISYVSIPHDAFVGGARESGAPEEIVQMMDYLFGTVLDGRNEYLADGVQRALGRPPRDFADYARDAAAANAWLVAS